mmetsp:Transcript_61263/g.179052  ORF Transcript_61263/g.179052 Transcript_61263/m.179052 type:complete len:161 (-) Transcript_61263:9-491(-)
MPAQACTHQQFESHSHTGYHAAKVSTGEVVLVGKAVSVFSRSADTWVVGKVVGIMENNRVRIEYARGNLCLGKTLPVHSDQLRALPGISKSGEECEPHVHVTTKFQHQRRLDYTDCLVDGFRAHFSAEETLLMDAAQDNELQEFMAFLGDILNGLSLSSA